MKIGSITAFAEPPASASQGDATYESPAAKGKARTDTEIVDICGYCKQK